MTRTIINCFSEGNASKIAYSQANGKIENNYLEKEGKIYKDGSEYQGDENLIINNLNQYIYENKGTWKQRNPTRRCLRSYR